jgi:hypothetical protein
MRPSIGRLNENTLHAQLKELYQGSGARSEVPVQGYIADVVGRGGRVIEIQTAHFHRIRAKLQALLEHHRVRLVYPLALEKEIVVHGGAQDAVLYRRKSPARRSLVCVVDELVEVAALLRHPGFELEVILTREQETRRKDGRGSWRRRGISLVDRRMLELVGRRLFLKPADYLELLPDALADTFTHRDLARLLGAPLERARRVTYCLRAAGVLEVIGREGRQYLFTRSGGCSARSR